MASPKTRVRRYRKRLTISCALLAILAGSGAIVFLVRIDSLSARKTTIQRAYDPALQAIALERHLSLKAGAATASPHVLLLGDSLTERWEREGASPWSRSLRPLGAFNAGIDNDRTENVLWRIHDGGLDFAGAPRVCVLLIGINNLAADSDTPYGVACGVEAVTRKLLCHFPETHVLVIGLLPAGPYSNKLLGRRVRTNRRLADLNLPRTTFIDVSEAFLNEAGGITNALSTDGLHLSEKGYETLAGIIAPRIEKLLMESR